LNARTGGLTAGASSVLSSCGSASVQFRDEHRVQQRVVGGADHLRALGRSEIPILEPAILLLTSSPSARSTACTIICAATDPSGSKSSGTFPFFSTPRPESRSLCFSELSVLRLMLRILLLLAKEKHRKRTHNKITV